MATADLIFVNGWDLEEALIQDLQEIGRAELPHPVLFGYHGAYFDEVRYDAV